MPRGGKRKGSGRKASWNHMPTKLIRVPEIFSEQLLEMARKLDSDDVLDLVTQSKKVASKSSDKPLQYDLGILGSSDESSSVGPLGLRPLAERLRCSSGTLSGHKDKPTLELARWTKKKDPDGLAWGYSAVDKKFYSIEIDSVTESKEVV